MKINYQHLSQDIFNKAHISSFSLKREAWVAQGQQSRAVRRAADCCTQAHQEACQASRRSRVHDLNLRSGKGRLALTLGTSAFPAHLLCCSAHTQEPTEMEEQQSLLTALCLVLLELIVNLRDAI